MRSVYTSILTVGLVAVPPAAFAQTSQPTPATPASPTTTVAPANAVAPSSPSAQTATAIAPAPPARRAALEVTIVESLNISETEGLAMRSLLVDALRRAGATDVEGVDRNLGPGQGQTVELRAVRLDKKVEVTASVRSPDGQTAKSMRMTAKSLDDFSAIADRMAKAIMANKSVNEVRDRSNITAAEGRGENRLFNEKVFGIRTAAVVPLASGEKLSPMVGLGFDGRFEADEYFLELGVGFLAPTSGNVRTKYGAGFVDLGAAYFLTEGNAGVYVGGGLSTRVQGGDSDPGMGVAPFVKTGVMFPRQSSTRFYAELTFAQNVIPMETRSHSETWDAAISDYRYNTTTDEFFPSEIGLAVGIGW